MKGPWLIALGFAVLTVGALQAEEEPSGGARWMLRMEHGPLKILSVKEADGGRVTYHYMTLKVTNPTSLPRPWTPLVKALTDTDRVYVAAGYNHALDEIRQAERNPVLLPVGGTVGKIYPGDVLDLVAIFGPLDPLYDTVKIHVYGLVDPIAVYKVRKYDAGVVIQDPAYEDLNREVMEAVREQAGEGGLPDPEIEHHEVAERRVFEMVYERLGDEYRPDDDIIRFKKERWTIVGKPTVLRVLDV